MLRVQLEVDAFTRVGFRSGAYGTLPVRADHLVMIARKLSLIISYASIYYRANAMFHGLWFSMGSPLVMASGNGSSNTASMLLTPAVSH